MSADLLVQTGWAAALFVAGLIHLIPVGGVVSARSLGRLYDLRLEDPGTVLLLRHRALLFGLLGLFLIVSAFMPPLRMAASLAALFSMLSFVVLAAGQELSAALRRVVRIDLVLSLVLAALLVAQAFSA